MSSDYKVEDVTKLINEYLDPNNMMDRKGNRFTVDDLYRGFKVELEHSDSANVGTKKELKLNPANDNPLITTQIALAHLMEKYDYYDNLDIMEDAPSGFWRGVASAKFWKSVNLGGIIIVLMIMILILMVWLTGENYTDNKINMLVFGILALLTGTLAYTYLGRGV